MSNEKSFFFVKSLDGKRAESFVNKNLLPGIDRSITNSAKFIRLTHVLRTDHGYDENVYYYESINLTFSYLIQNYEYVFGEWRPVTKSILHNDTTEHELDLLLICEVPIEGIINKVIGGYYPEERAKYINTWTVEHVIVKDLDTKNENPELLEEIMNFIEVAEVNAYWRYEKKYRDGMKSHHDTINNYYATMHDHITEAPSTEHFCERCQESPCACSDPDPG